MKDRYKSLVAVFLILRRNDGKEILLQKRKNTGYMDGMYDLSATGHLDEDETIAMAMVREAKEELGITIKQEDLKLLTVYHEIYSEDSGYLRFFFETSKYEGDAVIAEPDKCSEIVWADIDNLPENTIYHVKAAISNIINNVSYGEKRY